MESGKNWKAESDQMLSFFRHRRSRVAHTRWAHVSGGRCENNCLGVTLRLIPWIINLILAVSMVSMVWKFDSELNASHLPPKDLLYSESKSIALNHIRQVTDLRITTQLWREMPSNTG